MTGLVAYFMGGVLGSAHCVGMCGGIAVTIAGKSVNARAAWVRQLTYSAGRVSTYVFLGAAVGFLGLYLSETSIAQWHFKDIQRWLSMGAGLAMVVLGLSLMGLVPNRFVGLEVKGCGAMIRRGWGALVGRERWLGAFLAGVATGFLPCGLVYAFLVSTMADADVGLGALKMACFGLGTIPAMAVVGCGGSVIGHAIRGRVYRVAAAFVVLVGAATFYRGWRAAESAACPMCHETPQAADSQAAASAIH